jgi:hypothetical protein
MQDANRVPMDQAVGRISSKISDILFEFVIWSDSKIFQVFFFFLIFDRSLRGYVF